MRWIGFMLAASAQVIVGLTLVGTGGDITALVDGPRNVGRLASENALSVPILVLGLLVSGAFAFRLARAGHTGRAAALGVGSTYLSAFAAFFVANDFIAPSLILWMSVIWSWLALVACGILPVALAIAFPHPEAPEA